MTYNLADEYDLQRGDARWELLKRRKAMVDLTEKTIRTGRQNSYVHLIIAALAMETGNTIEYVKQVYFKKHCNEDIFHRVKIDPILGMQPYWRSSKDISKEEMSLAIDRFRIWASQEGYYLPSPDDKRLLESIEYKMGQQRQYL